MIRLTTSLLAAASVLAACAGATEPATTVPAVDGAYRFQVAFDSLPGGAGTLTLRRVGPVLRDSATGRRYQQLDGTVVYDGSRPVDALTLGPSDNGWPQYRSAIDETGRVVLAASSVGSLAFHAELTPAGGGRLAGEFHERTGGRTVYFFDGTISATRQP